MAFKDMLKYLRQSKGLSQREFAEKIGVSPSTISMYEVGQREPDFETEEKIADYFNIDLNTLRGKDVESPAATPALSPDREELLANYDRLNDEGKQDAIKYVKLLGNSPEYTEDGGNTENGDITA